MRRMKFIGLALLILGIMVHSPVLSADSGDDSSVGAIRQVLNDQVTAWNRGDVETFMRGYKDSPDTTFIGKSIQQGYAPILARYKKAYPNQDAMGTLDFSDLAVRPLDAKYAVVTGRFHLARSPQGGGDVSGIFSLVWENTAAGWKIIVDHSSVTTP